MRMQHGGGVDEEQHPTHADVGVSPAKPATSTCCIHCSSTVFTSLNAGYERVLPLGGATLERELGARSG